MNNKIERIIQVVINMLCEVYGKGGIGDDRYDVSMIVVGVSNPSQ